MSDATSTVKKLPFGVNVTLGAAPYRKGKVVRTYDPPSSVEVLWDDEVVPEVVWSNRLVIVSE